MNPLYQLVAALLSAHAPWWLLAFVVGVIAVDRIAIAVDRIGPIRLNLSIGDRTTRRRSRTIAAPTAARTFPGNTAKPRLPK